MRRPWPGVPTMNVKQNRGACRTYCANYKLPRAYQKLRGQSKAQRDQNKRPETGEKVSRRRRLGIARFIKSSALEFGALGYDPIAWETTHAPTPSFSLRSPICFRHVSDRYGIHIACVRNA